MFPLMDQFVKMNPGNGAATSERGPGVTHIVDGAAKQAEPIRITPCRGSFGIAEGEQGRFGSLKPLKVTATCTSVETVPVILVSVDPTEISRRAADSFPM